MDKLFYDLYGIGYMVNLERAVERRKRTSLNLNEQNIPFLCVSAVEGSTVTVPEGFRGSSEDIEHPTVRNEYACTLSHIKAIKEGLRSGAKRFCVFEDDIGFNEHFAMNLARCYMEIPSDWRIVSFGATVQGDTEPVSANVIRLGNIWGAWAYALTRKGAWAFYQTLVHTKTTVDGAMSMFNNYYRRTYGFTMPMIEHINGYSYILNDTRE